MDKTNLILLGATVLLLTSCAPFKFNDSRAPICNELNSKMIFNGNTVDTHNANLQRSESALLQKQYEDNHCDQQ